MVSVDTKKKELVGDFKTAGQEWQPEGAPGGRWGIASGGSGSVTASNGVRGRRPVGMEWKDEGWRMKPRRKPILRQGSDL